MHPNLLPTLDAQGFAIVDAVLTPTQCAALRANFDTPTGYRKTVDMQRHQFGQGQYRYFADPLPALVQDLRQTWYAHLQPLAQAWATRLGQPLVYPPTWTEFAALCRSAGAQYPTPLILRYGPGGHNTLHQDLYGGPVFPFQLVVPLSVAGEDYTGGELVLVAQRPRAQSRAHVVPLTQGQGLIFATASRPVQGTRGWYREQLRHGISTVHTGERLALGIIFHLAVS